jgi:WS/DGAT/MGAT family acyltransferase
MWIIEGLENDSWALINKTHHAMIDGVSGVDLATVIFDLSPEGTKIDHPAEPWQAASEPGDRDLLASGALGIARTAIDSVRRATEIVSSPAAVFDQLRDGIEGVGEVAWAGLNAAPATPLNVEIGPHRRFRVVDAQLEDFKQIKNALGGTVNDAVLTVVSGALRSWLQSRGVRTEGLELRALVPVSIRPKDAHHEFGNQIAAMRGPLPVYIDDPIARLGMVRSSMDGLKESKQALGAEVISGAQNFAPPTILAQASRLNFSTRLFNLIVTNVPGPQFPLYVGGSRLVSIAPVAFLPKKHALAIAIMSYDGSLSFGLLGDYDQMDDIDVLADALSDSIDELLELSADAAAAQ